MLFRSLQIDWCDRSELANCSRQIKEERRSVIHILINICFKKHLMGVLKAIRSSIGRNFRYIVGTSEVHRRFKDSSDKGPSGNCLWTDRSDRSNPEQCLSEKLFHINLIGLSFSFFELCCRV